VQGITVNLTVTGANRGSYSAVTGANGQASFSYTGIARGADTLVATPAGNAGPASSPSLVLWISPVNAISTTAVGAEFFTATSCPSGCEAFTTPSTQTPVFLQNFPDLMFDPFSGILSSNTTSVTSRTRPFTDIVLNSSGATTGTNRPPTFEPLSPGVVADPAGRDNETFSDEDGLADCGGGAAVPSFRPFRVPETSDALLRRIPPWP
jgi:hypothetical protein